LADRLHNLSTLPEGKTPREIKSCQKRKDKQVAETREFILPLAVKLASAPGFEQLGTWFHAELTQWCEYQSPAPAKKGGWGSLTGFGERALDRAFLFGVPPV